MILLLDNFDSFVYNLARSFEELGEEPLVMRSHSIDVPGIRELRPEALVISPGPCDPPRAGVSVEAVRQLQAEMPVLGVCLGHQVIASAFGGRIVRGAPVHGRAEAIYHHGEGIFGGLPVPLSAARYHSLVVADEGLPDCLQVVARSADGTIMAIHHRDLPIFGVQFHPESVLTEHGHALLGNFLTRLPGSRRLKEARP
jgi:anthranilate synthase/aminodeoxychorismate synthase-like glutamine amidotransferase